MGRGRDKKEGGKSQTGGVVEMFGWVGFSCPGQTTRYHCTDRLLAPGQNIARKAVGP